jgi:hypothetical protein
VTGVGDSSIQGYATSMSVNVGQTISFKIKTAATSYHIDILRLGYYGGSGARKIASNLQPSATLPQTQPACATDSSTGLIDCGNWDVSASWTVPSDAVSGVYIAHLVRNDTGGASQIPFVVRNDASHSDILLSTSDATWQAYNAYGGNSLYSCTVACPPGNPGGYKGAYAVSYNRPFDGSFATNGGTSYLYYAEYQMIRFLEKNGYDISYTSSSDVDASGSLLLSHKLFMSSGHDEYWSAGQRASVAAARDHGVSLAFFSGNEVFWKTRWAADSANTPDRTLISYKETHFDAVTDPKDPPTWSGTWRDPRFSPPADGDQPENALTGQYFIVNSGTTDIRVPSQYGKARLWRNTAAANLTSGQSLTLGAGIGTLGYEWDEDPGDGFRPPGLVDLSATTSSTAQTFIDYGTNVANNQTATHHLTLYKAASGAVVFGAGTVQWAWGLDNTNAWGASLTDPSGLPPDPNMQQATVNLLADMGAQPATLAGGLVAATASSDATAPSSSITSPTGGSGLQDGAAVTITGTANDSGGGVVGGVEVSTDSGRTWHQATLTTPDGTTVGWSYSWVAHGSPSTTIQSRATDDSGNVEQPSAGVAVNVSCPCSIWGTTLTNPPDSADGNGVEVGMKFSSDTFGVVSGVRFYKVATDTGTHVGSLWSSDGQLLAQATFSGETTSGWQQVTFSSPITINPNTTYIVSYFAPAGHYAASAGYFYPPPAPEPDGGGTVDSSPLHALTSGDPSINGVYAYSASATFPVNTYHANNYWVDPVFSPSPPPGQVTGVTATAGDASAAVSWTAPSTGGPVTVYTITPYIGSTAQPSSTVTGSPAPTSATVHSLQGGTAYTFTVQAANPNGSGPESAPSAPVTPLSQTAPDAPTNVTAAPATSSAQVSWTAPNSNGSAITGYTVTPYIGSSPQTPLQVSDGAATSANLTGLTNGTAYTFTVMATNAIGTGPESTPSNQVTPNDTIFDFATPANIDSFDGAGIELGVKFTASVNGSILGVRFYKAPTNTGTHAGHLWTTTGTLLASAAFTNETATGWQQAYFPTPVPITAGTTYIASYFAPNGHYSFTGQGLASAVANPPLQAPANGTTANGVYVYTGSSGTFPSDTYNANNYWVDIIFSPS